MNKDKEVKIPANMAEMIGFHLRPSGILSNNWLGRKEFSKCPQSTVWESVVDPPGWHLSVATVHFLDS